MPLDSKNNTRSYDPDNACLPSFHDAVQRFLDGNDTPRAYLERCINEIEAREEEIRAFVTLNIEGARRAADDSTLRYKDGRPLSTVDGLPIGIKDLFETADMPTQMNSLLRYRTHLLTHNAFTPLSPGNAALLIDAGNSDDRVPFLIQRELVDSSSGTDFST